jgi:hypothetical protein
MEKNKIDRVIEAFRHSIQLKEDGMIVGTGGFTSAADPKGPVAGFDPIVKFDGRSKIARRLPPPYRKSLSKEKK